jgi:hypothetical protein
MSMAKPVLTQTQLTMAVRGFTRAGFPPHRAIVKRESLTIFFSPDVPDEIFDANDPEAALARW